MHPKWSVIEQGVLALLKDEVPERGSQRTRRYDAEDLVAWWNNAQIRLASLKPVHRHYQYLDDGHEVKVPKLHYRPRMVVTPDGQVIERMHAEEQFFHPNRQGYYLYEDKIYLHNIPPQLTHFTYLYDGYYEFIKDESSRVEVPTWAIEPCTLYVAMQAVTREAVADARYRKFITQTDAGNPTHNPFIPVAKWLEQRFNAIISLHGDDDLDAYRSV